jgi:hypothetical protein
MPLTRSFKKLVQRRVTADPAFGKELIESLTEACEHAEGKPGSVRIAGRREEPATPARRALLAFAEAWTYPILGNEDVPVTKRLFEQARTLAKDAAASTVDPPEFAGWLEILRDESRDSSNEWEDTLHAVTDYFGLSTES